MGEGRACQASREQALSLLVKVGAAGCTQDFCAGVLELRCVIECKADLSASISTSVSWLVGWQCCNMHHRHAA